MWQRRTTGARIALGRRRTAALAMALAALALAAPATARDATVTSFDGTPIATHFFPAADLAPGAQAPTVLVGHGWGGEGDDDPESASDGGTGNVGLGPLRHAGFNVLTWDARGFGQSGGEAEVDSPDHEGRDVQALISWLADQPEAALDAPGDPRVGMSGVSYGGGIQLIVAALDDRVDAIAPTIAWHSLLRSLYRDQSVKQGWGLLLTGAASSSLTAGMVEPGGLQNGTVDPQVLQAVTEGVVTGQFSQQTVDFFAARGIDNLVDEIDAPTLLVQGTADTLFTPLEAMDTYAALHARGVPAKMVWFCGGHGICTSGAGPADLPERSVVAWLRRHLAGDTTVDTGPAFEWVADDGVLRSSTTFPLTPGAPLTGTGSGLLPVSPASPVTGGGLLIAATPAVDAVNVNVAPTTGDREIVGEPRVRITYSGLAFPARTFLYAQVVDVNANRVLGNQVTPIPVILDGQQRTVERPLEPIAAHATPLSRYRVQVAAGTTVYGLQRSVGAASLTSIQAELPVGQP
jgi:ABC-2 type transport system ATP-binding protein